MGREIRRVPAGNWHHDKNEYGHMQPKMDKSFRQAAEEWDKGLELWLTGKKVHWISDEIVPLDEDEKPNVRSYIENEGAPPDDESYYRPDWKPEEMTHYQYYETISEGTPLSPAFESLQALEDWLVTNEGHSRVAAKKFCESGYAPSMVICNGVMKSGVDSCEL